MIEKVMNIKRTSVYLKLKEKGLKINTVTEEDLHREFGVNPEIFRELALENKKP